jgi:membrane protease YdiL (CAAX protease family)
MAGAAALARLIFGDRIASVWFVIVVIPFAFAWPLLRGVSRAELRNGLGWHRGRGFWREAGAGVVGYLATLPVLAAGAVVTLILQRFSGSDASHPIVQEFGRGGWRTVQLFVLAAVWAPIVEETMFRGALYHHLRARFRWPVAAGVVALLFAAIHPQGWAGVPVLAAIAFSFAFIREWRGSIIAPVVAHAINNGAVTVLMILLLS